MSDESNQKKQLTIQNVCKALKYAYSNNNHRTKQSALNFFQAHSHLLPQTRELIKGFIKLPRECILELVVTRRINLSQEEIYTAVIQWSECQCVLQSMEPSAENKRAILGSILKKIKYTSMTVDFFNHVVVEQRVLSVDDIIKVYQRLLSSHSHVMETNAVAISSSSDDFEDSDAEQAVTTNSFNSLPETQITTTPRPVPLPFWFEAPEGKNVLYRFAKVLAGKSYPKHCKDSLTLSVSKNIALHGIYIFNSHQLPIQFRVSMKIMENANGQQEVYSVTNHTVLTNGESRVFLLDIIPPVDIQAGIKYDMVMDLDINGTTFYGVEGLPELQDNEITFRFMANECGLNGTNHKTGQFPILVYLPK